MYKIFALLFSLGLFFVACDDVSLDQPEIDDEITQDNMAASKTVGDVFGAVNDGRNGGGKSAGSCPVVDYNFETWTLTLTYDETCPFSDGIVRTGVITAVFDNAEWVEGTKVTITFDNFTRNGNSISGTIQATNQGYDDMQNHIFKVESIGDLTMTFSDSKTLTWNFVNYLTMTGGSNTIDKADETWKSNGTSSGTARNGKTFTRVETDLLTSLDCSRFVGGTIKLTVGEDDVYEMTFGPSCGDVNFKYKGINITDNLNN
ncbi:MAG: hypothetical protein P1P88_02145 [Bacteroidales bacterium]|nr:hypothetical protein [Bacteroidales bacterium]